MKFERSAGILLHPTSIPSKFGIGDFGPDAYKFIDFMNDARQTLWQVFPLGPTGYGDSPYQCFSAFAGNPLLISPELLIEENLLAESDVADYPSFSKTKIEYGEVIKSKTALLKKAFENFKTSGNSVENICGNFCEENKFWLEDFALFMAAKEFHGGVIWTDWAEDLAFRKPDALAEWKEKLNDKIEYQIFIQFIFAKQWSAVKNYANEKGIKIIGDLPIFIAYDSADLWANKELFTIDENGKLETVAGVPPDYFSPTGQLWGNPLYKWDKMEANNFKWWKQRLSKMYELVDIVRIDHFRGFDAYWEIPGDAPTAETGRWVKAPGHKLFNAIKESLGDVPILAEDLGVITKSVEKLRDDFEFPGMKILQFAFGPDGDRNFLPHNYSKNCVVYTGSHDNDTTRGFFENEKKNDTGIFEWAQEYLGYFGDDMTYQLVRTAYASVANIVIIPMQDILNLGGEARMNLPGSAGGNWQWRFTWNQINESLAGQYKKMTLLYERPSDKNETDEEEEIRVFDN
ncbi:MAG: 4-alpha-glucanotransferase [Chlorobi bacterium]|nr:4-alpha-glucanotransferase [Chlorobiota bacterium]